jgi:hypothetical protein
LERAAENVEVGLWKRDDRLRRERRHFAGDRGKREDRGGDAREKQFAFHSENSRRDSTPAGNQAESRENSNMQKANLALECAEPG